MRILWIIAACTIGAVVIARPEAAAASCRGLPRMAKAIDKAPAVFVGQVESVRSGRRWATVAVTEVWKGEVPAGVEVRSGGFDRPGGLTAISTVDRFYEVGVTYLFVPFGRERDIFKDNACTRTTRYRVELQRFRPSEPPGTPSPAATSPADGATREASHDHPEFPWEVAAAITFVLAGAAGFFIWVTLRSASQRSFRDRKSRP